jgi:hypothetical protein
LGRPRWVRRWGVAFGRERERSDQRSRWIERR